MPSVHLNQSASSFKKPFSKARVVAVTGTLYDTSRALQSRLVQSLLIRAVELSQKHSTQQNVWYSSPLSIGPSPCNWEARCPPAHWCHSYWPGPEALALGTAASRTEPEQLPT